MPYVPGDNWCICDLSGKKVLMSKTRKTWDGLRVWSPLWYPKHPQLSVKAIPERIAVADPRPRGQDITMTPQFGLGAFCLRSPGGLIWTFGVDSEDNLTGTQTQWGFVQDVFFIGNYALTVADDGTLSAADTGAQKGVSPWKIYNDNEELFYLTVEPDLSILLTPEA